MATINEYGHGPSTTKTAFQNIFFFFIVLVSSRAEAASILLRSVNE